MPEIPTLTDDDMMRELGYKECKIAARLVLEVMGTIVTAEYILERVGEGGLAKELHSSMKKLATGFPGKETDLLEAVYNSVKVDMARLLFERGLR